MNLNDSLFRRPRNSRQRHLPFPYGVVQLLLIIGLCLVGTTGHAQTSGSEAKPWWERTTFSGDFRSRYEGFHQGERTPRHRGRMRLRLRLDTELNDDTHFQLRVTSGDPGTPVSTNQTFTEFFLPKPFNLDRAFLTYNPGAAAALTLGAGKFAFPLTRTQMAWDDDLNWEGGYQQVAWDVGSHVAVQLVAVQTTINEVKVDKNAVMVAGYGQVRVDFGAHALAFSVADYGFGQVDQVAIASATGPLKSNNTNRLARNPAGEVEGFVSDFNLVDVIGEVTFATRRPAYPLRLLADWITNTRAAVDTEDTGLWLEAAYGRATQPKTYAASYTFGRIEQDAVLSPFMFSDITGSNLWLHMVEASYVPLPRLNLDLTLHFTKRLVVPAEVSNPWLLRTHIAVRVGF